IEFSRYAEDFEITVDFKAVLNTVIVNVNQSISGSLTALISNMIDESNRATERNDSNYVITSISEGNQVLTISAYTGEIITLTITENIGYKLGSFEIIIGNGIFSQRSGNDIEFSGFNQTAQIMFVFEKQNLNIIVQ